MKELEYYTSLRANKTVRKDHPIIIYRGKLDTLTAQLMRIKAIVKDMDDLYEQIKEVIEFCCCLMRAEVCCEPVGDYKLLGLTQEELREHSHHPMKYFGCDHIKPDAELNILCAEINLARALAREAEIAAVTAFTSNGETERVGILQALNRLSSALYIILCREYSKTEK